MKTRFHIPESVRWNAELDGDEKARLQRAILAAVRSAIEASASATSEIETGSFETDANAGELFSSEETE